VSRRTIWLLSVVRIPTIRSRVDCGFGLVMLSFCPTMRLSIVDFPALGFPATVTMPARCIGDMGERYSRAVRGGWTTGAQLGDAQSPRRITDEGFVNEVPAMAYSPATSRSEYHRRCRA
jgi:hypothetical protein